MQPQLILNDQQIFQLGTLDQGWWPDGLLTPPSDEAMVYEIEFLKSAGFNCLRKHIKVESARYYYHCGRLGLMVWQDMPSGMAPAQFVSRRDENTNLLNHNVAAQFELELRNMVTRLSAFHAIVMWVIHDEGWGEYDLERLTEFVRALDGSRIVNTVSGWLDQEYGDINDWHDYALSPKLPEADAHRALVLGEYGGIGWPIEGHLWDPDMDSWGYQTYHDLDSVEQAYLGKTQAVIEMMRERLVSGAIYTQTTDVEGEVNGLLTYDREVVKLSAAFLKDTHRALTDSS